MKFSYAGALVALTLASLLTACGGKAQYTVQGSVSGVTLDGLIIKNGGSELKIPAGATSFAFPNQIDYGSEYNIEIVQTPPTLICQLGGATGTAGYTVAIGAAISCSQRPYTVGGFYDGLLPTVDATNQPVARVVTLINGSNSTVDVSSGLPAAPTPSGNFTVTSLNNGDVYSISIFKQPSDVVCTLTNASGVIRAANISDIHLSCNPK